MSEYYLFDIQDETFIPDTIPKCYFLLKRLVEIAKELEIDYPDKIVWATWQVPGGD